MQVCTYSEYGFVNGGSAFKAFRNMGMPGKVIGRPKGMILGKMMGTGSGNGFSIVPNFRRYAIFILWETETDAKAFFDTSKTIQWYREKCTDYLHTYLIAAQVHGRWNGKNPFNCYKPHSENTLVAVLTRATIKPHFLPEFWMNVPDVSSFMANHKSALYRIGVGEYPLFMQATFSIWTDAESLRAAAYGDTDHGKVVKKNRERGWYAEEMFTRFSIFKTEYSGARFHKIPILQV